MDFSSFYESPLLLGDISELFSTPVIPKMVVVGLNEEGDDNLRLFKEILTRALDNLFVIEFCEQFIPESSKLASNQIHYRNHEVKESWMYKMRYERPAILIDFRLISLYLFNGDDSILCEQIIQTKNSLPVDGPVYLVWLAGQGISSQRLASIIKNSKMDKSTISVIELWDDATMITTNLKQRIQECFEPSRWFYQNLSKKYKKLVGKSDQNKFIQPWMSIVYYYFKIAVLEEFRGDFHSALKYYHTILAKFKELIEATRENVEERFQIINYLRKFADICFIRVHSEYPVILLLDQCGEAEFGLFRYLNYFGHGLNSNDQLLWRYNMSRGFARQLIKSSIWCGKNEFLMRGPAHFFIYSLNVIKKYSGDDVYQVQESIMRDLGDALDSALKHAGLGHFVDYLQLQILEQYFKQSLIEESGAFINYLKESTKLKGWKLIEKEVLKKSILLAKSQQNYQIAVVDEWRIGGEIEDSDSFEDFCLMHAQIFQEPIRLIFYNNLINCNVKFTLKTCEIFEECQVELNIYTSKKCRPFDCFEVESIGIFFDNEQVEPITFHSDNVYCLKPGGILKLKTSFNPTRIGKLKMAFVTMQLKRPFLALQFDDSVFFHQQNQNSESLEFWRICEKTLKTNLTLKVEAIKPKLKVEILMKKGTKLAFTEIPFLLKITNLSLEHSLMTEFTFENQKYEICLSPNETQKLNLKFVVGCVLTRVKIRTRTRFNLDLMDLKLAEICNFDFIEEEFESDSIEPVNPFKITLKRGQKIKIFAFHPVEWLCLTGFTESFVMEKEEQKSFKTDATVLKGTFRLKGSDEIFNHQWTIK